MFYNGIMHTERTEADTDVSERLEKLDIEIRGIRREINQLRKLLPVPTTLTVSEIAEKLGVSTTTLYKPWNLPHFGKPEIGNSPRRWKVETVDQWYSKPEADRRAEWEAMSQDQKAAYR